MVDVSEIISNSLNSYDLNDIELIDVSIPYNKKNSLNKTGVFKSINLENNINKIELIDVSIPIKKVKSKKSINIEDIEIIDDSNCINKNRIDILDDIIIIDESKTLNSCENRKIIANAVNIIREKINDSKKIVIKIVATSSAILIGCFAYCKVATASISDEIISNMIKINAVSKQKQLINSYNNLFVNNIPKSNLNTNELTSIKEELTLISDVKLKESMFDEIEDVSEYVDIESKINKLLINDYLIDDYNIKDIDDINTLYLPLKDEWKHNFEKSVSLINEQSKQIIEAKKAVDALFIDSNRAIVNDTITREAYNIALFKVNAIKQSKIKASEMLDLNIALKQLEENEEKIRLAWIINEIPYVSQNNNKVYNGCEAASMLMALQYKGYLKDVSLNQVATDMPKSDTNPHDGFIRNIYEKTKDNVPHWIAPDALTNFARSYSGNSEIYDLTGTSFDKLIEEVKLGNPVIIYITSGTLNNLNTPIWVPFEEAPKNLHVGVLKGYNPISKQVLVSNPWTFNNEGDNYYSIDKITEIYNEVGRKAVVVR